MTHPNEISAPASLTPRSLRSKFRLAASWGAALLVSSVALAATVKGQIKGHNQLVNPVWEEASRPEANRYTWREPSPTVRAEFRTLFGLAPKELCIVGIKKIAVPPPAVPTLITIGGGRTTPVTIVVAPQTRLRFRNSDPFKHRIYAVGEASFSASDMNLAGERDWTAPGPGTYELRDELAPSLRAWVVVKAGVASIGYPDRSGAFFLTLEPGEYTLETYFAGKPLGKPRDVTVTTTNLDLSSDPFVVAEEKKPETKADPKPETK